MYIEDAFENMEYLSSCDKDLLIQMRDSFNENFTDFSGEISKIDSELAGRV